MRVALIVVLVLAAIVGGLAALLATGALGRLETAGAVTPVSAPAEKIAARTARQRAEAMRQGVASPKQILFGDLHVHTTFSFDAFIYESSDHRRRGRAPTSGRVRLCPSLLCPRLLVHQ